MKKNYAGQALLVILLATTAILVVALSVVSKTVSDVQISTQEEESLRAFSAAEAGLEEALKVDLAAGSISDTTQGEKEATYEAQISDFGSSLEYEYPKEINSGETATIWLSGHDPDGNLYCDASPGSPNYCYTQPELTLCWGDTNLGINPKQDVSVPAAEVMIIYEDVAANEYKSIFRGYDPHNTRYDDNKFEHPQSSKNGICPVGANNYMVKTTIDFASMGIDWSTPGVLKAMIVKLLYNPDPHPIAVVANGGQKFPSQGRKIDSTGVSGVSSRRVEVNLLYPDVPVPFTAAVSSKGNIIK